MQIAVFTAWPELIRNQHAKFNLVFKESCHELIKNTFETDDVSGNINRLVACVHDRKYHAEFDMCLFVVQPMQIEISDIVYYLDNENTTYFDPDWTFVFYQRKKQWSEKTINVEKSPNPAGVIFIDCWEQIAEVSSWPEKPHAFDFYADMQTKLCKYKISSMVFHTGAFGDLPLANQLECWKSRNNFRDITEIEHFKKYYQSQKIYNWIVVGAHWQRCTHEKPLGFYNLLQLKKQDANLRIYSHQDCTVKFLNDDIDHPIVDTLTEIDYKQDNLQWRPNGNLFELVAE